MNTKIILGIVVATVILGGGYFIWQKQEQDPLLVRKQITSEMVVTSSFAGRYEQRMVENDEMLGTTAHICHTFVVTNGDDAVIEYFKDMVRGGNTIHTLTTDGHLRINLPWNSIPQSAKSRLQSDMPVTIELTKEAQIDGRGAGPCHSFFSFVSLSN
jgi:hypothetical protein